MEEEILKRFRESSLLQMQNCVPLTTSNEPLPIEITTVFRFDSEMQSIIRDLQNVLSRMNPDLYYYPRQQLHMTVLGKIPRDTDLNSIRNLLKDLVEKKQPLFNFFGTGMGPYSTSLSAYPINFSLKSMRDQLRNSLKIQGSDYSVHLHDYEYVGWINFVRNMDVVPDEMFRQKVLEYKDVHFGEFSPIAIDILENKSWVLDPDQSKLLERIEL